MTGKKLKAWRERVRRTQAWAAKRINTHGALWSGWEMGHTRPTRQIEKLIEKLTGGEVMAADWDTPEERAEVEAVEAVTCACEGSHNHPPSN